MPPVRNFHKETTADPAVGDSDDDDDDDDEEDEKKKTRKHKGNGVPGDKRDMVISISEWDKFDVDTEMKKIDEDEVLKDELKEQKRRVLVEKQEKMEKEKELRRKAKLKQLGLRVDKAGMPMEKKICF